MAGAGFYIGLGLVTASTLMLQLIQTRILSVIAWYHLAFFAVSMAMFGLSAGAVFVYLGGGRYTERTLSYDLSRFSAALALTTGLSLAMQMALTPVVLISLTSFWTWVLLAVYMAAPYFFSGVVVSLALTRSPFAIGRVYGVDLLGAAVGCPAALLLLDATDGPSAVLWTAAIFASAATFFAASGIGDAPAARFPLDAILRRRKTILVLLAGVAVVNGATDYGLQPLCAKGSFEWGGSYIFRDWNSFSRVAVSPTGNHPPHMWGPSPHTPRQARWIDQRHLTIDADAGSVAYRFNGDLKQVEFLKFDVTNFAYHLPGLKRAAIIGIGAGRDVLSAALFGIKDITGIEINPILVELLTREAGFADFTGLNALEGVRFVADEGRSWLARTDEAFDVIQMSLIDTWAATGAGAFTLSENGLYTVEAWRVFLSRLAPGGVFTVSRWYDSNDVTESGRLLSLAMAALFDAGAADPRRHVFLVGQGEIATLVLSRDPFSVDQVAALNKAAEDYGHVVLVGPTGNAESPVLGKIARSTGHSELVEYTSSLDFDLTPPTDDRPFFFNQLPLGRPLKSLAIAMTLGAGKEAWLGGIRRGNLLATATLLVLFVVALLLVLATIVVPLTGAIREVGWKLVAGGTMYFLLIGMGFMMVEIGLMQRASVFLGHPMYSLSVLLCALILSSGLGSFASDKAGLERRGRFTAWAVCAGGYILFLPFWIPRVMHQFEGADLPLRIAVCIVVVAPAGVLMGFAFPTGMKLACLIDRRPTPWFWGINGAAGVLASIVAVAVNIACGISVTLMVAAVCYLLLIPIVLIFLQARRAQ